MANTYVDYTASASQTDFAFSFPYLEDTHVVVEIDGVDKTITTDFTIPSVGLVRLNSGATAGQAVRVKRISDFATDLVNFVNGSVLNEADLDRAYQHNRYLNEEAAEGNDASMQLVGGGTDFNAANKKIVNLASPTASNDATNKDYVDTRVALSTTNLSGFNKSTHTGDNTETEFTLSFTAQIATPEAYRVTIDGVVQTPTTAYSINTSTNKIAFTSAPPTSAEIVVVAMGTVSSANDTGVVATGSTTSRTLADRFADTVNVLDYGVKNDGTEPSGDSNTTRIQSAIDTGKTVYFPDGTYKTGKLTLTTRAKLLGAGPGKSILLGTDTKILEPQNGVGYAGSEYLHIEGLTFKAETENQTTAIRGQSDSNYITYATVRDCTFELSLQYGIYGNFLQSRILNCLFGKTGTVTTNMTTGIYLNGDYNAEANANLIHGCYVANVSGVGIYISSGWNNTLSETVIEVTGREALHIDGGLQTNIHNVYIERIWEKLVTAGDFLIGTTYVIKTIGDDPGETPTDFTLIGAPNNNSGTEFTATGAGSGDGTALVKGTGVEGIIKTSNNTTTGDGVYTVNISGGLFQSSAGVSGGYFLDAGGNAIVNVKGCSFGGLTANPVNLAANLDKVLFDDTNYYPGGFTNFSGTAPPKVVRQSSEHYQAFDEEEQSSLASIDDYVKVIRHKNGDNISSGSSVLGLQTDKFASTSYNLIKARVDMDGTPETVFNVNGAGETNVGGGNADWSRGRLVIGTHYLWVDSTGDLRINNGAPSSDTDGTVVGTQS